MEKKWYRAPFIKGVLVVLAHIAVVASLMGFTWVILCAGVNYVIWLPKYRKAMTDETVWQRIYEQCFV